MPPGEGWAPGGYRRTARRPGVPRGTAEEKSVSYMTIDPSEAPVAWSMSIFSGYARRPMSPEDIKALRQELGCTARELATALGIEQETVLSWERAELFPTKRY